MSEPEPRSTPNDNPAALPVGTRLGEYELRSVIGVGGFGIVYLAFDHALEREVAIKEYMPATLATRSRSIDVAPLSQAVTDHFETGLRSFVNEGRMLAHFDSPSLLKVHRYWEANGTAYITMPLYRGGTLTAVRAAMTTAPDEAAARALLMPLLSALELLHRESIYHRDIAPDNILIEAGNLPVLLDFGAARRVVGETSQALTAILKPAYAPIEQYGETASVKQGAWTDLYALGATLHFYLLGQAPPPSTSRALHDEMVPLAARDLPGCSRTFLRTIDWMLAPRPRRGPWSWPHAPPSTCRRGTAAS
jgi:serine/threonine protein kinase